MRTKADRLREAAERVRRVSDPGTPERFLTLCAVADETGFKVGDISQMVVKLSKHARSRKTRA